MPKLLLCMLLTAAHAAAQTYTSAMENQGRVPDAAEASVLRMHGFGSLVMLPLILQGEVWGLVEAYRHDVRAFTEDDIRTAIEISSVG